MAVRMILDGGGWLIHVGCWPVELGPSSFRSTPGGKAAGNSSCHKPNGAGQQDAQERPQISLRVDNKRSHESEQEPPPTIRPHLHAAPTPAGDSPRTAHQHNALMVRSHSAVGTQKIQLS
jgi:hypothetical protein